MGDVDANMRNRPQPPPLKGLQQQQTQPFFPSSSSPQLQRRAVGGDVAVGGCDAQTALRVRRWIESRSVGDVRECRPLLNAEIKQGFALRKTQGGTNDRSAPRF